jgi:hypothetical protein
VFTSHLAQTLLLVADQISLAIAIEVALVARGPFAKNVVDLRESLAVRGEIVHQLWLGLFPAAVAVADEAALFDCHPVEITLDLLKTTGVRHLQTNNMAAVRDQARPQP